MPYENVFVIRREAFLKTVSRYIPIINKAKDMLVKTFKILRIYVYIYIHKI